VKHVGELGERVGPRRIVRPGRFDQINERESQIAHHESETYRLSVSATYVALRETRWR
jgi:hypothetical protein